MSYQYKVSKVQLRANVNQSTDDIIASIAKATNKSKGAILEDMLSDNELFKKAKSIKEIIDEEHIEKLKIELGL